MRQVQATFADVDRPAHDDDAVTIDITGTLDGETQEGLTADDYSYTVGSGAVTAEVDEQLRGAKAGDILEFEATHPDPDEERGLRFRVLVKQVRERVLPDADDEWASENSEFDTIDELRWKGPRASFEAQCHSMGTPELFRRAVSAVTANARAQVAPAT